MCVSLRTLCVSTKPKRRAPAGAAKPDSGEATMRKHGAEVLNSGEPNNVSCWRSTRHPGRMAGGIWRGLGRSAVHRRSGASPKVLRSVCLIQVSPTT